MGNLIKVVFIIVFSIFCMPHLVFSQDILIRSKVLDAQTGEVLPFANIMLLHHNIGTTSDIGGSFTLYLQGKHLKDTLAISYMGYQTKTIMVSDVKPEGVSLASISFELEAFQFIPGRSKTVLLNPFKNRDCFVPYDSSLLPGEYWVPIRHEEPAIQAMYFQPIDSKSAFIKEVWIHTSSYSLPAFFRLRLFKANENLSPGIDLLTENIMLETTKREELLKIDLEKYRIVMPENGLFVGVELMIIPENLHFAVLPDASDSVALYSPYLSFYSTKNKNDVYWIYSGGRWRLEQIEQKTLKKNEGYLPAISLVIEE